MRTFNTPERGVRRGLTGHKLQTTARRDPVHSVCKIDEVLRNSICRSVLDLATNIYTRIDRVKDICPPKMEGEIKERTVMVCRIQAHTLVLKP
jgi:hypothetical protein